MDPMHSFLRQRPWGSGSPAVDIKTQVPGEESKSMDSPEAGQIAVCWPDNASEVGSAHRALVSPCAAAGRRPVFDCLLLDAQAPVQALLDEQGAGGDEVVLVQEPEGLLQESLTLRTHLTDSGALQRAPGRLFGQTHRQPLCLVLDCRKLTGAQLTSYNDVLDPDTPSLYDPCSNSRQPLGRHVRILVLLSHKHHLAATGAAHPPGQDFWRRVVRPGLTLEWTGSPAAQDALPLWHSAGLARTQVAAVIDFHLEGDWRRTLYGGMGIDQQGRMRFFPGALARLSPGQRVALRGADWSDAVFCHEWLKLQRTGCYDSNGCQCRLPAGLTFVRTALDLEERQRLGRCIVRLRAPAQEAQEMIVVNHHNLHQWLVQGRVTEDGRWQQADALQERLACGAGLIVSSPLGEAGWLRLLGRLCAAGRGEAGIGVLLACDDLAEREVVPQLAAPQGQTADLATEKAAWARLLSPQVRIRSWQNADQITAWLEHHQSSAVQPPQVIRVHPGTRLGVLFDDLHVLSGQRPLFGLRQTALERALTQGQPVVIRGLETNTELQWQLESLLCQTPSLLINGRWRRFPAADVTLLWPDSTSSPAPLWVQALAAAVPLAAVDQWEALRRRWQLDASQTAQLRQTVTALLRAWGRLPSRLKDQAGAVPVLTASLLDNLVAAACHQARQEGTDPAPHHWRRAIDAVLSHRSRGCPPVRDFLKAACLRLWPDAGPADWVDPDRLAAVVPEQGRLDRAFFKEHLWRLLRALGPDWLPGLPLQFGADCTDADLSLLVALLRIWGADCCQQMVVAQGLEPDEALVERLRQAPIRCGQRLKRLGDALAAGWRRRPDCGDIYPALLDLAAGGYWLRSQDHALAQVQTRLQAVLEWEGAADIEAAATAALARDLLSGGTDQAARKQRRLARLRERLEQTPVLMIEGPTATGKSHFAAEVAHQAGPAWVVSVGAGTTERDLVQRWVWKEQGQDRTMLACDQPILTWARACPVTDGQLVTLVIDEANLAAAGVLDSLKGLWNQPPCVYIKGEPFAVSSRHRVILTGNPEAYAGRRCDLDFARLAVRVHFPRLDDEFLCQQVVLPCLQAHLARHVSPELVQETAATLVRVWNRCQPLLPDRTFTPRDLVDLCAWLGWYVSRSDAAPLSAAALNGLVLQALRDLLEGECDQAGLLALRALESWMAAHVPVDRRAAGRCGGGRSAWQDSCFVQYARQGAPDFATAPAAVMAQVAAVNRDLDRCLQARKGCLAAGRRQATLIEGPAGRGKDACLRLVLDHWQRQCRQEAEVLPEVRMLCASDCPWDALCEAFREARIQGQVLVISELNLVESQYLEGELNAALAGEAAPGFHLFATINPADAGFSGRQAFSPALLGRFRRLVLADYSHDELTAIARQLAAGQEEAQVRQLVTWHMQLCQTAHNKGLALRPVNQSLMQLVRACRGCSSQETAALFDSHYKMYLQAASTDRASLAAVAPVSTPDEVPQTGLTHWVNRCAWLDRPLTVWTGAVVDLDARQGRLVLPSGLSEPQARELLQCALIRMRWRQETGLPDRPPAGQGLEAALYLRMQQLWCQRLPAASRACALALFCLSPVQQQTLNMPCNSARVQGLDKLCLSRPQHSRPQHSWPQQPWQWQAIWHRMRALCCQSGGGTNGPPAAGQGTPGVQLLDGETDEDTRAPSEELHPGTFGPEHDDRLSRLAILSPVVVHGCLGVEPVQPGRLGYEGVLPAALCPDRSLMLDKHQHYGVHPVQDTGDWNLLPSVDAGDRLVQIRTDPARMTEVIRDCDTGLHYVRFLDAGGSAQVWVHFVLEVSGEQTRETPGADGPGLHPDACCDPALQQRLDAFLAADRRACLPPATALALEAVTQAGSAAQRVDAIYRYCRAFEARRAPQSGEDLLEFLLRERQGSCRHRAPVYVLLCRRWSLPARIVEGHGHQFVEYSLDAGRSWRVHDLGGSRSIARRRRLPQRAQPHWRACLSVERFVRELGVADQKLLLANLKAVDRKELAVCLEVSLQQFDPIVVPEAELSLDHACRLSAEALLGSLWNSGVMEEFMLGCRFMTGMNSPTAAVLRQVGCLDSRRSFLSGVLCRLCQHSPGAHLLLREPLMQLGVWLRRQGEYKPWRLMLVRLCWLLLSCSEERELQTPAYASSPQQSPGEAAAVRRMQMEDLLCWLARRPELQFHAEDYSSTDLKAGFLLESMLARDAFRSLAVPLLQCWYKALFSLRLPSDGFAPSVNLLAQRLAFRAWRPSCYGARLPSLEAALYSCERREGWTDQPEGMPDVERLVMQRPAFRTRQSVQVLGRQLILLGSCQWSATPSLYTKAAEVLDRIDPAWVEGDELHDRCWDLLLWAYCCCLYETVGQRGGVLHAQVTWIPRGARRRQWKQYFSEGLVSIKSLEQLVSALVMCPEDMKHNTIVWRGEYAQMRGAAVQAASKIPDALVLVSNGLSDLLEEFLATVDVEAVVQAMSD